MAQTIAVRSGSVSHTFNNTNSNYTTLFTQSTGTATKVTLNQLIFVIDSNVSPYNVGVWLYNSTTGQRSLAYGFRNLGNSCSSFSFFPGMIGQPNSVGGTANGTMWTGQHILANYDGNITPGDAQPASLSALTGYYSSDYVANPGSIYMANGDSLQVHGYWSNRPGTVYYSFTTITEG